MTEFPKTDLARLLALPEAERTLAILSALRFVAKEDLSYAGVNLDTLERIESLGYPFHFSLQRRLTSATTTDVYALRRKGAVALARELDVDPDSVDSETNSSCRRSAMFLDHSLARSRFVLALATALGTGHPAALLSWEQDPERLADAVFLPTPDGLERQPLVADGLAVLRGPRGPEGLLIEIDRATERPGYLGRKYRGYLEWWKTGGAEKKFGLKAIRLATIAPDDKRLTKLVDACRDATALRAKGLYWFATESDLTHDGILAPVWRTMAGDRVRLWT